MKVNKQTAQLDRLTKLLAFDDHLRQKHNMPIIGVDEVGRGSLAGPVVACAVALPTIEIGTIIATKLATLNDSKQVKQRDRESLSLLIREHAVYAIADATVAEIDELNIFHASLKAMHRAVQQLLKLMDSAKKQTLVLVDGNAKIPRARFPQLAVIKGDALSASLAAASIVAKVHRDKIMVDLAQSHPHYHWHSNKGYGSQCHRQAIAAHGLTNWHRRSFVSHLQAANILELEPNAEWQED